MKDIPVFTSEFGVASLILREIPHRQEAYVRIQAAQQPKELLKDCIDFCRACGAERVYAAGHEVLERYPVYARVVKMVCSKAGLPESGAALFPVTEKTLDRWLAIYKERMMAVPNAAGMGRRDGEEMLKAGDGYFVHKDGELLGIGRAGGDTVSVVIATQPGAGQQVLCTLAELVSEDIAILQVAEENIPAVKLYHRLGFVKVAELVCWYQIF